MFHHEYTYHYPGERFIAGTYFLILWLSLNGLQFIIEELKKSKKFSAEDEILRGTNSEDKTYGSEQYITQLIKYNSLTLFATHDLALSALEEKHHGIIKTIVLSDIEMILYSSIISFGGVQKIKRIFSDEADGDYWKQGLRTGGKVSAISFQ